MSSELSREFFERPVLDVAPDLLGVVVTRAAVSVRLTEVEAYDGPDDPGSHAYRGQTRRNATMFGPAGHLYVYFTYGMHWCANMVCGSPGRASAVLLRGGEVVKGVEVAQERRGASVALRDLARGPARLAQSLGLERDQDGTDLFGPEVQLWRAPAPDHRTSTGPRVGLRNGAERPWRFWIEGDRFVSPYRPAVRRPPR
ncbi:MAG: DNA-3-methyladenine glycosylase [Nocardioidaceae bacterium]